MTRHEANALIRRIRKLVPGTYVILTYAEDEGDEVTALQFEDHEQPRSPRVVGLVGLHPSDAADLGVAARRILRELARRRVWLHD